MSVVRVVSRVSMWVSFAAKRSRISCHGKMRMGVEEEKRAGYYRSVDSLRGNEIGNAFLKRNPAMSYFRNCTGLFEFGQGGCGPSSSWSVTKNRFLGPPHSIIRAKYSREVESPLAS